ncbi:hypothetical protein [Nocardioides convexus]|nr:hypothetical protein [Nocardioides convexus]
MFRDPRDVVISGYFSAVKTHQNTYNDEVERLRDELARDALRRGPAQG